jgi:uroporphyrinogen-III decarboxylase
MAADVMTPRERWWAAIRFQPVDRLPFWPKLDAAYPRAQEAPFNKMSIRELHQWIGSDEHLGVTSCVREVRARSSVDVVTEGNRQITVYHTPFGDTTMVKQFDPASQAWHPMEFPVRDLATLKAMTAFFEDTRAELDEDRLAKATVQIAKAGDQAMTFASIGESPLMYFVEWLAGIENSHLLLADYPGEVGRLFHAVHRLLLQKAEILARHSPTDVLYMIENTSTTLISPRQYRQYCYPHISDYGKVTRDHGRVLILHMCGKLKLLLPDLAKLPVEGFEAFTAPPLGSTTLLDGRTSCPDKCLVGGTHAMLWTRTAEEIVEEIAQELDPLPHHRGLVVTSAGVMPPLCPPETIKAVCDWVKGHAVRV